MRSWTKLTSESQFDNNISLTLKSNDLHIHINDSVACSFDTVPFYILSRKYLLRGRLVRRMISELLGDVAF